jgi:hypothetical protein
VTITETDRFETLSLYYDKGNLTIITTHNVRWFFFLNLFLSYRCLSIFRNLEILLTSTLTYGKYDQILIIHMVFVQVPHAILSPKRFY